MKKSQNPLSVFSVGDSERIIIIGAGSALVPFNQHRLSICSVGSVRAEQRKWYRWRLRSSTSVINVKQSAFDKRDSRPIPEAPRQRTARPSERSQLLIMDLISPQ